MLADLRCQSERRRLVPAVKKTHGATSSVDQRCYDALHCATRALAGRWPGAAKHC